MARRGKIEVFEASVVFRGLLDGVGFTNRVAHSCLYRCPRCHQRIRFRWHSFYQGEGSAVFERRLRRRFDELTPPPRIATQDSMDFFCPGCRAPTRIVYIARDSGANSTHFELYLVLVGPAGAAA